MLRLAVWAVVGLLFVASGLLVAAGGDGERKEVQGKIKKVGVKKRLITVTREDGKDEEFEVAKDAKISVVGKDKEAKLGDLKKGSSVTLVVIKKATKGNGRGRAIAIRVKMR